MKSQQNVETSDPEAFVLDFSKLL